MSDSITMTYGDYAFQPIPLMQITKEFQKDSAGNPLGTLFKTQLQGTLCITSGLGGLSPVITQQDMLRNAFAAQGQLFQITCNSGILLSAYPRINSIEFDRSNDNWVLTCPYSIDMEFDEEPDGSGENPELMPPYISTANESWSVEFVEDKAPYFIELTGNIPDANPYQLRVTHNISAVGKNRYTGTGLSMQAWEQAQQYVIPRLGYNGLVLTQSGVLNIPEASYYPFNHIRVANEDINAGSYSVTESWIVINSNATGLAGNAIEDFNVEVKKTIESDISTVSIQGSVVGLESRTYGTNPGDFSIEQSKYEAALAYWSNIADTLKILPRVQTFASEVGTSRSINVTPTVRTVGFNPAAGTVSYSYEYNDRPSNCISGALLETISVVSYNPTDVFAEIGVLGRSLGPVLQDMGTITSSKREITVDVVMAPSVGCDVPSLFATNPRNAVNTLILEFYDDIASYNSQVFQYLDTENWSPKDGHYSRQVGYIYQAGCM